MTWTADERLVAVAYDGKAVYPERAPYPPDEAYPEFGGRVPPGTGTNAVFSLVREALVLAALDPANAGARSWNPLGGLVEPGMRVLLKPNLVRHVHLGGGDAFSVVTHGSVIRAVADYVALALRGDGEIVIGDAPVQGTDFPAVLAVTGLEEICADLSERWKVPVRLVDFRLRAVTLDRHHGIASGTDLAGDPAGYTAVDLGSRSLLAPLGAQAERFRVTSYSCRELARHHSAVVNEYLIPRTVLEADAVLNLPKLKTHRKVGMTAALKNFVGINGHKDWLPHHREGSREEGGDEYLRRSALKRLWSALAAQATASPGSPLNVPRLLTMRLLERVVRLGGRDCYFEGSWHGNDTIWRTVLDLNRLLIYAGRDGRMRETPQRGCLTLVDAVVAGEGEGPMEPDSRRCGAVVAGRNPVAVDTVLAALIGFDPQRMPLVANAWRIKDWPLIGCGIDEIRVSSNRAGWTCPADLGRDGGLRFAPPTGWAGHVEKEGNR